MTFGLIWQGSRHFGQSFLLYYKDLTKQTRQNVWPHCVVIGSDIRSKHNIHSNNFSSN